MFTDLITAKFGLGSSEFRTFNELGSPQLMRVVGRVHLGTNHLCQAHASNIVTFVIWSRWRLSL